MKKWRNKRTTNRKNGEKIGNMERRKRKLKKEGMMQRGKKRESVCEREREKEKISISEGQREREGTGKQENTDLGKVGNR